MSVSREYDRKEIFRLVVKHNPDLRLKEFQAITGKPERTCAYWLAGEREPDDMSLHLIGIALRVSKRKVPRELNRLSSKLYGMADRWGKKNMSGSRRPVLVGNKKQDMKKREFFYKGELSTLSDIAERSGHKLTLVYSRIVRRGRMKNRTDVTEIIDRPTHVRATSK